MRALPLLVAAVLAALCAAAPPATALPPVKHVFVVVLENQNEATSFGAGSKAPYLAHTLTAQGEYLPSYYAIGHLSNPNYIAMISGQGPNPNTQSDCQLYVDVLPPAVGADGQALGSGCVYPSAVRTVADQLTARGLAWRGYMEDMGNTPAREPATCAHPSPGAPDNTQSATPADQYATRHDPFVYFHSIVDSPICQQSVVPLSRLSGDLASAATTPSYSLIVPSLCSDGHDSPCADGRPGGLVSADAFLRQWVPLITGSPAYRDGGLLVVTFDESGSDSTACCNERPGPASPDPGGSQPGPGGGKVGAVVLSPYVRAGSVDAHPYNHYSLLASVEDLFGLGRLAFAANPDPGAFGADVFNAAAGGGGARRLSLSVRGLGRGCVRGRRRLRVRASGPVRKLVVTLDGHRLAGTTRSRLSVRLPRLAPGRHRLRVRALDTTGRRHTLTRRVRGCARAPRFLG